MLIGLTYDLRADYLAAGYSEEETAEFDGVATIDAIDAALRAIGHQTDRIGSGRQLVDRLAAGNRWDLVFNLTEGLHGTARESQVPAILDLYEIPYTFSDPLVLAVCLHKGLTKTVVGQAGLPTTPFVLIKKIEDVEAIDLPYPLFAKPVAEGTGKGISANSKIKDRDSLRRICLELLASCRQPVLVETFLPGREFTVGLAGRGDSAEVLGMIEVNFKAGSGEIYSYQTKTDYETLVTYSVPDDAVAREAAQVALAAWRALRCVDAGRADIRCDAAGRPNFIEVNPLAGLNPTHSDLPILCRMNGIDFTQLIGRIMTEARTRQGLGLSLIHI